MMLVKIKKGALIFEVSTAQESKNVSLFDYKNIGNGKFVSWQEFIDENKSASMNISCDENCILQTDTIGIVVMVCDHIIENNFLTWKLNPPNYYYPCKFEEQIVFIMNEIKHAENLKLIMLCVPTRSNGYVFTFSNMIEELI